MLHTNEELYRMLQKEFACDPDYPKITFDVERTVVDKLLTLAYYEDEAVIEVWAMLLPKVYSSRLRATKVTSLNGRASLFYKVAAEVADHIYKMFMIGG